MTVTTAAQVLEAILRYVKPGDPPEEHEAVTLGIEALKLYQVLRGTGPVHLPAILPGETLGD